MIDLFSSKEPIPISSLAFQGFVTNIFILNQE